MKWCCFNCGLSMGNGIPPFEAMSVSHGSMLDSRAGLSMPVPFEGMSRSSFCAWCLLFVDEFGQAAAMDKDVTPYRNSDEVVNWVHANREMWFVNIFNAYGTDLTQDQVNVMDWLFDNMRIEV